MFGALEIRNAREDDLERLVDIHLGAFPDPRGAGSRKRTFQANPFGGLDDLYVVTRGKSIVAHAFLYAMHAWLGGRLVQSGGIGSVGVAAEARGQGVAHALLARLHAISHARGDALTLLYAFRHGFYRRLGYGAATPMVQLEVDPSAVPAKWVAAARGALRNVERDDHESLPRLYDRAAIRATGWLARRPVLWERRLLDEQRAWFITRDGRGYISWTLEQREDHAATRLLVHDLVAEDDATWRTLWGHLGAQKDQVHAIEIHVTEDDPALCALVDIDGHRFGTERAEHPFGTVCAGPMLRVHDVAAVLRARGYGADGALVVGVEPAASQPGLLPPPPGEGWGEGGHPSTYALHIEGGRVRVAVSPDSASAPGVIDAPFDLLFSDAAILSSVVCGGVRLSRAARAGLVTARDRLTLERADHLLALPAFHALDPF